LPDETNRLPLEQIVGMLKQAEIWNAPVTELSGRFTRSALQQVLNQAWSIEFVADQLQDGRRFRAITDQAHRELEIHRIPHRAFFLWSCANAGQGAGVGREKRTLRIVELNVVCGAGMIPSSRLPGGQ
jgi:hypothetical protein